MKVIVDLDNPGYCETRSVEFIEEAKLCQKLISEAGAGPTDPHARAAWVPIIMAYRARYHECMKKAISLIGLARLRRPEDATA